MVIDYQQLNEHLKQHGACIYEKARLEKLETVVSFLELTVQKMDEENSPYPPDVRAFLKEYAITVLSVMNEGVNNGF